MIETDVPGIGVPTPTKIGTAPRGVTAVGVRLRLYVARSTPNSLRAERNLAAALGEKGVEQNTPELEVIDVFTHPKRAITDSVIITPTLIGTGPHGRFTMIGDLADSAKLMLFLQQICESR